MMDLDDRDDAIEQTAPVWAVFGDLMSGLLGAFVLILVGMLVVQMDLVSSLKQEVEKRQQEEQRRIALEHALAGASPSTTAASASAAACCSMPARTSCVPTVASCSKAWCSPCASTWGSARKC
jgi:hypothetical protein